ncbi:hypothetical protein Egran_04788, partial [Elaphomyces granulatus]
MMAMF